MNINGESYLNKLNRACSDAAWMGLPLQEGRRPARPFAETSQMKVNTQ